MERTLWKKVIYNVTIIIKFSHNFFLRLKVITQLKINSVFNLLQLLSVNVKIFQSYCGGSWLIEREKAWLPPVSTLLCANISP